MAGGSRIVISDEGITVSTNGKILYQAGQHKFEGGQKVSYELPLLPSEKMIDKKSMRFDLGNLDFISDFSQQKYRVYRKDNSFYEGTLDARGRTKRIFTEESEELELFIDHSDFVVEEEFFIESHDATEE